MKTFEEALRIVHLSDNGVFNANIDAGREEHMRCGLFPPLLLEIHRQTMSGMKIVIPKALKGEGAGPDDVLARQLAGYALAFNIGVMVGMEMEKSDDPIR